MKNIMEQLACNSGILSSAVVAEIVAGRVPPKSELIYDLLIVCLDADALTMGDKTSTWNERRASKQNLALAFLLALAMNGEFVPDLSTKQPLDCTS